MIVFMYIRQREPAKIVSKEWKLTIVFLRGLNVVSPEGNGRTQRMYIEQLCQNNGRFEIDFTEATKEEMILASVQSANVSNDLLEALIYKCLVELVN